MREILHIFKKDVRRHWPEILVSFVFLGLYMKVALQGPNQRIVPSSWLFFWFRLSAESVTPLMILFWIFLTVRLVQGEPLVGDRQWWVTKPYEWWTLLAAKELFQLLFISLPLFAVQLFLLYHAGFPIFPHLLHLLEMQFALGLVLFIPSVALGSLTRTLWQALIGVILTFVAFAGVFNLLERIPSSSMSSSIDDFGGDLTGLLVLGSVIGATGWQFARRKTWRSRTLLLVGPFLATLMAAITPYAVFVNKKYPLLESDSAPAHFALGAVVPPSGKPANPEFLPDSVYLRIPLLADIAPGHVIQINGVRLYVNVPGALKWDPGWKTQWIQLWPESVSASLSYEINRKDFEKIKTASVKLRIELALTDYQEAEARDLLLAGGRFLDERLGICHLDGRDPSQIDCVRPFQSPGGIVSFDPSLSKCVAPADDPYIPDDRVSHSWLGAQMNDDVFSPGLNPVADYQIALGPRTWQLSSMDDKKQKTKKVYLCPGARLKLAKPKEVGHMRVQLQMDEVRLQDLATGFEFGWD